MDDVPRWRNHGCYHPRWCHVPALAPNNETGRLLPLHGGSGPRWIVLRHCHSTAHLLHHYHGGCFTRYLDIPQPVRGCRIRKYIAPSLLPPPVPCPSGRMPFLISQLVCTRAGF
jgi:hypothetical protein